MRNGIVLILTVVLMGCGVRAKEATFQPGDSIAVTDEQLAKWGISELYLKTPDGERIYAVHLENPHADKVVLFFHGNAGTIFDRVYAMDKLRTMGFSVLGLSYRGYANSSGEPSEQGMYTDAESLYRHVTTHMGVSGSDIVLYGRSLGTTVAIDLAQDKTLGAVILVSPFTNSRELFDSLSGWQKFFIRDPDGFIDSAFRNASKLNNITAPVLVAHGNEDAVIPIKLGQSMFEQLPMTQKEFLMMKGAGHNNFGFEAESELDKTFWEATEKFLIMHWRN